jgi:hypothetical protein
MKIKSEIYTILLTGLLLSIVFSCKKESPKMVPLITIAKVTNITANTAISGGEVTSDGGSTVTTLGVCWSVNQNPTILDSKTSDGAGIGSFTSSIAGLTPGTVYNIRAYAINTVGTSYSSQLTFTTIAVAPILTTIDVSAVTSTSASCGGNITNDGGTPVTARGVCWSTNQNPTVSDSKTTDGTGSGGFTSSITGLTPGVTYYAKAYAANSIGIAYGNQVSITATAILPVLTTNTLTSIYKTTAISGGNIINDGGAAITARGVCWSTSQNPTIVNNKTNDGIGSGSFTSSVSGLSASTSYYVRAYATNSIGTTYGNQLIFITATFSIGDNFQGGKVAYIDSTGLHGLIAATNDQSISATFYNNGSYPAITTGSSIGTGSANTTAIINSLGNTGIYAAKLCRDYRGGGYSDWYLPSRDELGWLFNSKVAIGGFANAYYWGSTQTTYNFACAQNFATGIMYNNSENTLSCVRAVRTF